MFFGGKQRDDGLEESEVPLFLLREKRKLSEERNNLLRDLLQSIHFVVPDPIRSGTDRSATEMMPDAPKDALFFLGNIETSRHFPRKLVVLPFPERNIETSLTIRESGDVPADFRRRSCHTESFLLIVCTERIVTRHRGTSVHPLASTVRYTEFPAYSQIY